MRGGEEESAAHEVESHEEEAEGKGHGAGGGGQPGLLWGGRKEKMSN